MPNYNGRPERMMRTILRPTARKTYEVTNPQTAEPTTQDYEREKTLKKLVDRVVSEEHQASGGHGAQMEVSETVKAANVRDAILGIPYLTEDALVAIMTRCPDVGRTYGDSRMAMMMQAMIDKAVSVKFESVYFEIRLRQTIDGIVSMLQYTVNVTKALLETDEFLKSVADAVKTEDDRVIKAS